MTERRDIDDRSIAELLNSVREVRTTLAIELSAAAGALEDERPEIARDILSATSQEIAAIGAEARDRRTRPTTTRRRSGSRKALLALPVIPLVGAIAMTAAAAFSGHSSHATNNHRLATTTATSAQHPVVAVHVPTTEAAHTSATTTLHRLESVVQHDTGAAQVLAVAADLHQQLTAMIATATNDPARLHVVRQLLILEQHVLEASKVPGTQLALAASREIARLLAHTPNNKRSTTSPATHATTNSTTAPHPTPTTTDRASTLHNEPKTAPTHKKNGHTPPTTLFGGGVFGGLG